MTPIMASASPSAHIIELGELDKVPHRDAPPVLTDVTVNPLHLIKAKLEVRVGEISLTVGELMAAREHEVFSLKRRIDEPVDLLLEGRVVARGELVAMDDQFAVRITELPVPLKA